jgi:hypothetical protein
VYPDNSGRLHRKSNAFTPTIIINALKIHIFLIVDTSFGRKRRAPIGTSTTEKDAIMFENSNTERKCK